MNLTHYIFLPQYTAIETNGTYARAINVHKDRYDHSEKTVFCIGGHPGYFKKGKSDEKGIGAKIFRIAFLMIEAGKTITFIWDFS